MDIIIRPASDATSWEMIDLLDRSMGRIFKVDEKFVIEPSGHAVETMKLMKRDGFQSLDEALTTIETHTRGTCQMEIPHPKAP